MLGVGIGKSQFMLIDQKTIFGVKILKILRRISYIAWEKDVGCHNETLEELFVNF